jgi:hypothetical protein
MSPDTTSRPTLPVPHNDPGLGSRAGTCVQDMRSRTSAESRPPPVERRDQSWSFRAAGSDPAALPLSPNRGRLRERHQTLASTRGGGSSHGTRLMTAGVETSRSTHS